MPLSPETVSAFAAYSGLFSSPSKKQRRRKIKKAKQHFNESTPTIEVKKKRKNPVTNSSVTQKKKKRKTEVTIADSLKEESFEVSNNETDISKNKQQKNRRKRVLKLKRTLTNGIVEKQSKNTKNENNTIQILKSSKKISKGKRKKGSQVPSKLLTEQLKHEIVNNFGKKNLKNVTARNQTNKVSVGGEVDSRTEIEEFELKNIGNKSTEVLSELLKSSSMYQEDGPTLISKINQKKKDLAAKELMQSSCPVNEMLQFQTEMTTKFRSSIDVGKELFNQIISPIDADSFFVNHWEKAPLYIPGSSQNKFSKLMSTPMIDNFLRQKVVMFGKHIDITSYKDGKRETHNPEGRALPHVVWDLYNHQCSVRLLCPQAAFSNIFVINTKLQDYFGCFVGANAYLTPPNSQGFAPHYDDIEAFVLQIEGQKNWKLYNPRNENETLPRYSSKNFVPTDLGKPLMEITLKPGDLLYFPRGVIHQADTGDLHSLHLTVSVYQKTSWVDLLEKALPIALAKATEEDVDFRRGLPLNFLNHAGMAYQSHPKRKILIKSLKQKMARLINYLDIDAAVDMMGVEYISDALPPVFTHEEASRSTLGNGLRMESNGQLKGSINFSPDTKVRFTTAFCHRLIREKVKNEEGIEEEEIRLYYSTDNSLEYHGEEPQYLVIPEEYIVAVETLSINYPLFTAIKSLPLDTLDSQASLVGDLWDRGILMTEDPLDENQDTVDDNNDEKISSDGDDADDIVNRTLDKDSEMEDEQIDDAENNTVMEKSIREYDKAINEVEQFITINDNGNDDGEEDMLVQLTSSSEDGEEQEDMLVQLAGSSEHGEEQEDIVHLASSSEDGEEQPNLVNIQDEVV